MKLAFFSPARCAPTCPLPALLGLGLGLGLAWLFSTPAQAQTAMPPAPAPASASVPAAVLTQGLALLHDAAAAAAPPGARISVEPGVLDPRLTLAPCARVEPYLPAGLPAWGRTRLGLRCLEGARWNVGLPVLVKLVAPGLVAAAALPAGIVIDASQLRRSDVEWTQSGLALPEHAAAVVGRTLARAVMPGQALHEGLLAPRQWFKAGDTVQVKVLGDGFSVASEGQALGPGLDGRLVRVQMGGGSVVQALPSGERKVELRL